MSALEHRGKWNAAMQRVDAGYLYELGDAVRCVRAFKSIDVPAYEIWQPLSTCRQKLAEFLQGSVYVRSIHGVLHVAANSFVTQLDHLIEQITVHNLDPVTRYAQARLQESYEKFEPIFQSELSRLVTYLVLPKGAYDVLVLVDQGAELFPFSVRNKVPEAVKDIEDGAKALAFELWTSAAFHFHRANEAVLRRYFDLVVGSGKRPKTCTMGTMIAHLRDNNLGDNQVRVALDNIKEFHRNPNSHPGDFIEDAEEAFSLVAAIRAAMGYMLDHLPHQPDLATIAGQWAIQADAPPMIEVAPIDDDKD